MKSKYSLVRVRASRRRLIPGILAAALAMALCIKPSQAQSGTWTGAAGTGIWGGTGNWFNNTVASGSGSTASFVGEYTATQNVAVNAARTIGNITFTDTTPSHDVNIVTHTTPFVLTLQVATGSPTINVTQAGRTLTIGNVVAGTQGLTKSGLGTLALSNTNTLTGAVVLSAGTLRASNVVGALGAGTATLTLSGGTLQLANDAALNFARNTTVNANTAITSDRLTAGAGVTHTLGTLSIGANTLTVNRGTNATSGTGGVTFGATTLTGASTVSPGADSLLTFSSTTGLVANTLTKSGAGQLTLTGVVSGTKALGTTALQINGGTVAVTSNSNTFTGNIAVDGAGSLFQVATGGSYTTVAPWGRVVNSGTAANTKQIFLTNGGGFRLASGSLNVNNTTAANYGAGIIFNIGTGGGVLDVASGATLIIDDGNTTGTGLGAAQIQGAGSITKNGLGVLQIDDSTAYAGTITVTAGTLQPASANAFGAASAGTTIQSGAQLNVNGVTMTNAEPLTISGTGLASDPQGALVNRSGTGSTWTGPITMSGDSTIGSTAAGGLTLSSGASVNTSGSILTLRITGTGRIFSDGVISGTGSLVMNGSSTGDYVPRGDHTYSGGTALTVGFIAVDRDTVGDPGALVSGPFGTGTVTMSGAQLRSGAGQNRTVANDITMSADTTFYTVAAEKTLNFTGPVTLSGASRVITANVGTTVAGTSTIFSGPIGDGGNNYGLTKTGTGNLVLGGANTYTGGTTANNGSLVLRGSVPANTALSIVPNSASGVSFSMAGGAANALSNVSDLSIGSLTGPTTLGFELGANTAASDSITTPNPAIASGTVNIAIAALPGFGSASSYDLLSAPSGLSGATYALNAPGGFTYSLNVTDSLVQLGVTPAASGDIYWRGNTNGNWSALSGSNTNWTSDAAGLINAQSNPGAGNTVRFSAINATTSGGVIATTLNNDYTVRNLIFSSEPNGVNSVTIAGGLTPALNAGTLAIAPVSSTDGIAVGSNAGAVTISAPVILGSNQTWSVDGTGANGSALTVSGAVTGSSSLNIGGLVTISSANGTTTYSGPTTVNDGGILQGGAGNSLSANSAVTVNANGILRLNGSNNAIGSLAGSGVVENNAATGATLTAGADGTDTTFSGILRNGSTANLGFTKTGAGNLTLIGANTHTGTTTVNAGTLIFGNATTLTSANAVTLSGTGILDLNGFSPTIGALTSSVADSTITNNGAGSGANTLAMTASAAIAAAITDGDTGTIALRVTNENGTFALTNGFNTFSGGIVLTNSVAGTRMNINSLAAGTANGSGTITVGESPTDRAGIYFSTATGGIVLPNPIVVNTALGTDRVGFRTDIAGIILSGVITANLAPATFTANTGTAGSFSLTNKVTGASGLVLDITSLGASATQFLVTLNNATLEANDYQGDTVVNLNAASGKSATLQLLQPDQIPNGTGKGNVIVNSNGSGIGLLSLAAGNETINGLSGSGNVASTLLDATLTLGDNNATASHSGSINNTTGILSVTKIGTGTQTLSGSSNFVGDLTVNGGTVAFPSSPATTGPLGNSTVVNLDGGGISYTGSGANDLNRPIVIAAGSGTVDVSGSTGVLTVPSLTSTGGNLIKTGPGTAVLTGSTSLNAGAASVVVQQGTLRAGFGIDGVASVTVGGAGHLDQNNATIEALVLDDVAGALTLSNGSQLSFELNGATSDSIDTGATGTAVTSGVVTLNLSGTPAVGTYNLLTSTAGGLAGANYVIGSAPNGFNYTINKSDNLVSLTVSTQTLIHWRGGQDLSWNTLGSGTANWTTDGGGLTDALSIPTAADAVIFSAAGAPMVDNTILTNLNAAFTVDSLQFSNTPTGVTAVAIGAGTGGALTLSPASSTNGIRILSGGGAVTISAPLSVGAAQTWDIDATGSLVVSGDTTFTNAVNKTNGGALTLSGNNSGTGAITLSAGTLNLNSATALGTGTLTIGAGTTINTAANNTLSTNNAQNWNGDFTFTGSSDLNLGSGAVSMGSSLQLTTSGSILSVGGAIGDGGSNHSLTKAGAGTLVLGGSNTYGGATTINAGVLRITNGAALGSTAEGTTQSGSSALELDGTGGAITVGAEPLTINGGGVTLPVANLGALRNIAGDNTYGGTITLASQARINSDSGTLTLNNPSAVSSVGRTLVIGGEGNTTISGAIALGSGGVAKGGTGTLTLSGANTYTGNTSLNVGVLNMTGSLTGNGTPTAGSNLLYGVDPGNSVLNISGNITNYFRFQGATNALANAAYIQTGGTVNFTSTQTVNPNHAVASNGYGYMEITGGTMRAGGRFAPSNGATTTGVMYIGGSGTFDNTTGEWLLMAYSPSGDGGRAMMTVATGGTVDRVGSSNSFGLNMDRNNGYAVLNVAGGTILNSNRPVTFGNGTSAGSNTTGILNLAAGTLQIGTNFGSGNTGAGSTGNRAFLNFAGGTLRAQAALTAVIPATSAFQTVTNTVFGSIDNAGTANDYNGGLVVDTNSFNVAFTTALLGAENTYGVTQDNIGDLSLLPGNSGYIGAPMVQFDAPVAGGTPASGYALISGGKVTGIVITSPGTYQFDEQPNINLTGGGGTIPPFSTSLLQTLNTAGGLTKNGTGTLTMSGANTYAGATSVNGGTLLLNGTAATFPTTSGITVSSGGTLAFTSGSASALDMPGKTLNLNGGTLGLDVGAEGASDTINVDTFTLSANSSFAFTGVGAVGGSYTLLTSVNPIVNTGAFAISGQTLGRVNLVPTINANSITVTTTLDEGVWNQTGGGNWSVGNSGGPSAPNWDNYKPTVPGDAALFGSAITAPSTVLVDTPHTVSYLRFDSANAYTIGANGSGNLSLNNGSSIAAVTVTSGSHTIAENVALLSNTNLLPATGTTLTVSGVISGAGRSVDINGSGSVELTGTNTYSGATSLTNGTLTVSAGAINTSALTVGSAAAGPSGVNAVLRLTGGTFNATQFTALSAGPSNVSSITISGDAQVTLPAHPTARGSGSTATLTLDSTTGFLSPAATTATYMPAFTFDNAYLTANGAKFNVPTGRDITIGQVLENATEQVGTLTKSGVGTLTLSGANFYSGATTVLAGALSIANVDALGTLDAGTTVADGGRVVFNPLATGATVAENFTVSGNGTASNGVLNVGGNKTINLSGDIVLSADSRFTVDGGSAFNFTGLNGISADNKNLTINTDGSVASSITGPLAIGTGTLTKTGNSTLTLGGDSSYSGGTIISGGVVSAVTSNNALGSGPVNISGGLRVAVAAGLDVPNAITVTSTPGVVGRGTIESSGASGTGTFSGPITILGSPAAGGLLYGAPGTVLHLAGPITAAAQFSQRDGSVMYSGGGTGYSGIIITGTAIVGANDGIATTATVRLGGSNPASLDLNGFNQRLVGVEQWAGFAATVGNSSTTSDSVLTTTGSYSFVGRIVDVIGTGTRKVGLTVASGSLTLTGANTHTGGTTVDQGVLTIGTGGVISGATGPLSVNNTNTAEGNATVVNLSTAANTTVGSLSGSIATPSSGANTATINTQTGRLLTVNQTADATYAGVIAGSGDFALGASSTNALTLSGVNTYTGTTTVNAGTLLITGSVAGTASAGTTGVLGGTGTVTGAATIATTGVLSPGVNNVGTLNFGSTLTLDAGSNYAVTITGNGVNDKVNVTGALTASGDITVSLDGYTPVVNDTFDLADAASIAGTPNLILPTLSAGLSWDTSTFATNGQIKVISADPFLTWASGFGLSGGDAAKSADPDGDGVNNLLEFATNSNPTNGGSGARVYGKIHMIAGTPVLTYTVATRADATFAANGSKQESTKDLIKYTIEGSDDLSTWNTVVVTEVLGGDATAVRAAIVPALPTLETGWEWHTFRTDGDTSSDASDYIRLNVTEVP
jgi:autotransporter-associated beta strand protein